MEQETFSLENDLQSDIASLAYQLWEENGRPEGTSARDWEEAERLIYQRRAEGEEVGAD